MQIGLILAIFVFQIKASLNECKNDSMNVTLCGAFEQAFDKSEIIHPEFLSRIVLSDVCFSLKYGDRAKVEVFFGNTNGMESFYGMFEYDEFQLKFVKSKFAITSNIFLDFRNNQDFHKKILIYILGQACKDENSEHQWRIEINTIKYAPFSVVLRGNEEIFLRSFINAINNEDMLIYRCISVDISNFKKDKGSSDEFGDEFSVECYNQAKINYEDMIIKFFVINNKIIIPIDQLLTGSVYYIKIIQAGVVPNVSQFISLDHVLSPWRL